MLAVLKWLADKLAERLFNGISLKSAWKYLVTVWLFVSVPLLRFLRGSYTVFGWELAVLWGYTAAITAALALVVIPKLRGGFRGVILEDRDYKIEWRVPDVPRRPIAGIGSPLSEQVTGPYHLLKDCRTELQFILEADKEGTFKCRPWCRRCDPSGRGHLRLAEASDVDRFREEVLTELDRRSRNGHRPLRKVILGWMPYHGAMLPPA